jgi:hypothetical protein
MLNFLIDVAMELTCCGGQGESQMLRTSDGVEGQHVYQLADPRLLNSLQA